MVEGIVTQKPISSNGRFCGDGCHKSSSSYYKKENTHTCNIFLFKCTCTRKVLSKLNFTNGLYQLPQALIGEYKSQHQSINLSVSLLNLQSNPNRRSTDLVESNLTTQTKYIFIDYIPYCIGAQLPFTRNESTQELLYLLTLLLLFLSSADELYSTSHFPLHTLLPSEPPGIIHRLHHRHKAFRCFCTSYNRW